MNNVVLVLNFVLNALSQRRATTEAGKETATIADHLLGADCLDTLKSQFMSVYQAENPEDQWPAMMMLRNIVEQSVRTLSKEIRNREKTEERMARMGGIDAFNRHQAALNESQSRAGMPPRDVDPLSIVLGHIEEPLERLAALRTAVEELHIELQGIYLAYESAQTATWADYQLQGLGYYSYMVDSLTNEWQTVWDLDEALNRLADEAEEYRVRQNQARSSRLARIAA
ncbi:MAG: hypothetical protein ACRBBW_16320 [Cellvibrionaceae bacterium]